MTPAPWLASPEPAGFAIEPIPEHARTYRSGIAFDRPKTLTAPAPSLVTPRLARAGAFGLDALCLSAAVLLSLAGAAWILGLHHPRAFLAANPSALAACGVLVFAFASAYAIWFLGAIGRTPGMARFGLHLVAEDGSPLGFAGALSRWGAVLLATLPLGLGLVFGLHDRLAKTRLVSR